MMEEDFAIKQEQVTEESQEEAVAGVTSADPTQDVADKEVQEAQETEHEEVTSDPTVEVAVEEDTPSEEVETQDSTEQDASEDDEDLMVQDDEEDSDDHPMSMGDINFEDYIDNIPQLRRGATVKGVIVRYDDENVYVDVRDKSEGKILRREFEQDEDFDLDKAIETKEPIEVYVKNIRNTDTGKEILLSKARVDFIKHRDKVEEALNNKEPIEVKVIRVVKDGIIGSYGGVEIYIHRTQLDFQTVEDLDAYLGQTITILVTQFDTSRRRLRVSGSRRSLLNRDRRQKSKVLWDNIAVGDIYEGVVRNLTNFGAFVDIGGVDGLVHISELSWDRIKHPSEVIKIGDVIQVYVKDFDKEKKRISLGYKRIEDDPYNNIEERFPVGSLVHGKVVRMFNFGTFIEIDEGVDALCHISQISNRHLEKPGDVLTLGQEVDARVLDVSNEERKISVSIRDVQPYDELIGEAAEKEKARLEKIGKKNAGRAPSSYLDSSSGKHEPSDMELAFAAAKAQQAEESGVGVEEADAGQANTSEEETEA